MTHTDTKVFFFLFKNGKLNDNSSVSLLSVAFPYTLPVATYHIK